MSSAALPRHRHRPAPDAARPRTADRRPEGSSPGRFRYDTVTGTWWWSPEMCRLLGLDAATPPSTEMLLAAHRPADGDRLRLAIADAAERGRSFALVIRTSAPARGRRPVVLLGEPFRDERGAVRAVDGVCADLTGGCPADAGAGADAGTVQALQAEVSQMRAAMASRAVIEQAKGILMLLTSCGEQGAFQLLTHISSHTHRKVRDVAQSLTDSAARGAPVPGDVATILRDACPH